MHMISSNLYKALIYFSLVLIILPSCLPESGYKIPVNFEPVELNDGWKIDVAAAQGFNPQILQDVYDMMFSEEMYITSRSLLIVRNGRLVSESYFRDMGDRHRKASIRGITKSITSLLFGLAYDRELVGLDHTLYNYLPEYFDGDQNKRDITLEDLLTMKTGLDWNNKVHTPDLFNDKRFPSTIRIVITKSLVAPAGSVFDYNHGTPQLIIGTLRKAFNHESTDMIVHELFDPLGIDDFIWEKHNDGLHIGGIGLHLKPRDLARFGQFCLQEGWWSGRQVISSGWINTSTETKVDNERTGSFPGYGYYWWLHEQNNAYFGMGEGGQYLYIVPEKEMVIVHTASPSVGSGYAGIELEDFLTVVNMILSALE